MTITDLIEQLERLRAHHGDLDVLVCGEEDGHAVEAEHWWIDRIPPVGHDRPWWMALVQQDHPRDVLVIGD